MRAPTFLFGLAFLPLLAAPALAALSEADLSDVALRPAPHALVPGELRFSDDGRPIALGDVMRDRPTLLILADYNCHTICGPILAATEATIRSSGLAAGRDFNLVVIGIDPTETRADANEMKQAQFGDDAALAAAAHFLRGDARALAELSAAIGYHARYDAVARRYAHPTDLIVLTPDRHLSRLLPGLGTAGGELRAALVEARDGYLGAVIDRAHVLCYGLDPAHGVYNAFVRAGLIGAGGATLAAVGAMAAIAQRRRRRLIGEGGR
ncbi:MAG TPA: SCO family protein [Roseiarcus sp.]|jgi:protein SCO1/2